MNRATKWFCTLCLLGWVAACAGGSANTPGSTYSGADEDDDDGVAAPNRVVNARGSGTVIATLGAPGGSLELSSGPRVEIPPGAIEGAEEFVLKKAPLTTAFSNDEAERAAGPTFLFSPYAEAPEGRVIKVSIPMASLPDGFGDPALAYEYEEGARVGAEDSIHTRWDVVEASISGGRLTAEMEALPGLRMQFTVSDENVQ